MMRFIRSLLFNIAFYSYTVFWSLVLMWAFLLPRRAAYRAVYFYFYNIQWLEKFFLGLHYRVTGWEHLPKDGHYILAMKHQSAYETLKLLPIFGDIAVILKRELTRIPFWGWYTIKTGMIPVDRGAKGKAMASIIEGGRRVMAEGRPIVIFPQGTRVPVGASPVDYPYKIGVAKISEELDIPIIPVAINSGVFWGRNAFLKQGGVVDFKILPALPQHLPAQEKLTLLQDALERESDALVANAEIGTKRGFGFFLFKVALVLGLAWTLWWHAVAWQVQGQITMNAGRNFNGTTVTSPFTPAVEGFPFALHITWPSVTVTSPTSAAMIDALETSVWPLPGGHGEIFASNIVINAQQGTRSINLDFDNATVDVGLPKIWLARDTWALDVTNISLVRGAGVFESTGAVSVPLNNQTPYAGEMTVMMTGHGDWIDYFVEKGLIDDQIAGLARGFMDSMAAAQGGERLSVPLTIKDNWIYVGPIRAFNLRPQVAPAPVSESDLLPPQTRPADSETISPLDLNPQILPELP